jgi:hypothetical protein
MITPRCGAGVDQVHSFSESWKLPHRHGFIAAIMVKLAGAGMFTTTSKTSGNQVP